MQRKLIAVELGKIGIDWALVFMEKAMAPHTSTLAWKTPWAEEPGGLQSMRSLRVRHDWVTSFLLFTFMHWRRKWQPTPVFLPGESQRRGVWWAAVYGVAQSRTLLKRLSSSSRTLGGQQKHAVPTKCIAGSISKKRQRTKIKKSMKKTLQLLPHKIDRIKKHYTNKLNYLEETVNF